MVILGIAYEDEIVYRNHSFGSSLATDIERKLVAESVVDIYAVCFHPGGNSECSPKRPETFPSFFRQPAFDCGTFLHEGAELSAFLILRRIEHIFVLRIETAKCFYQIPAVIS